MYFISLIFFPLPPPMKLPTEAYRFFFKMCVIGITVHLDLKRLFSEATFLSAL